MHFFVTETNILASDLYKNDIPIFIWSIIWNINSNHFDIVVYEICIVNEVM